MSPWCFTHLRVFFVDLRIFTALLAVNIFTSALKHVKDFDRRLSFVCDAGYEIRARIQCRGVRGHASRKVLKFYLGLPKCDFQRFEQAPLINELKTVMRRFDTTVQAKGLRLHARMPRAVETHADEMQPGSIDVPGLFRGVPVFSRCSGDPVFSTCRVIAMHVKFRQF